MGVQVGHGTDVRKGIVRHETTNHRPSRPHVRVNRVHGHNHDEVTTARPGMNGKTRPDMLVTTMRARQGIARQHVLRENVQHGMARVSQTPPTGVARVKGRCRRNTQGIQHRRCMEIDVYIAQYPRLRACAAKAPGLWLAWDGPQRERLVTLRTPNML